jgi:hypothetical protein
MAIVENSRAAAARALAQQRRAQEQVVLQEVLPLWDDFNRGVPDPFIRSGLFSVGNTEKREYVTRSLVNSLSNYHITYTGQELQQEDLSVWMALINMARGQAIGDSVFFTGYRLIKDLNLRIHSDTYKRMQACIHRLKVTGLTIASAGMDKGYSGSLIREYQWAELDGEGNAKWMVRFEPRVVDLFRPDATTLVEWEIRKKIGTRANLALWLHSYYTTPEKPNPVSVVKLHEMCGSKDQLSSFRRNIKLALAKLVAVDFLSSFDLTNDIVCVTKTRRPRLSAPRKK